MSYVIEAVASSRSRAFDEGYAALVAEFAPRGELERREVIARWLDEGVRGSRPDAQPAERLRRSYHMLIARDEHGALAGVRDCHVVLDERDRVATIYFAHVLVLPPFRRTGLAALLRSEPVARAHRFLADAVADPSTIDLLLAAEMEPPSLDDEASIIRLVAYGKDGFAAIAPAVLPYCQPDFRDLERAGAGKPRAIPLLAIVRFLGHEGAPLLPVRLARAFVTHLYAVFATHVRLDHLAELEARTLGVLDAFASANTRDVPLLPLPRTLDDAAAVTPLSRAAVMPFFPQELR